MEVHVRRIRPDEGPLLKELRLRSLADAPDAFGQRLQDAATQPDGDWHSQARAASEGDRRSWLIAEIGGAGSKGYHQGPVGIVLVRRRPPDTALIFSMWVDPRVRRAGVGRALIDAAAGWSAEWGAERLVLWVVAGNEPALRFYQRLGFTELVTGPDADSGRMYGALAMTRPVFDRHQRAVSDPSASPSAGPDTTAG